MRGAGHKVYPYLLRDVAIERAEPGLEHGHHVCSAAEWLHVPDGGHRLVQPLRAVLAVVEHAGRGVLPGGAGGGLGHGCPEVFNTDQGVQFTAASFTSRLEKAGAKVSMDGKGRCLDNVFVERLWRTVKYEEVYLWGHETVPALQAGLARYFPFYNHGRRHQSLDNRTPADVYCKTEVAEG